jgi:hypothetical protein
MIRPWYKRHINVIVMIFTIIFHAYIISGKVEPESERVQTNFII